MQNRKYKLKEILLADLLWLIQSVSNNVATIKYPENAYTCLKINNPSTTPDNYIAEKNQNAHNLDLRGMFFKVTKIADNGSVIAQQCSPIGDISEKGLSIKFNPEELLRAPFPAFKTRYSTTPRLALVNFTDPDLEPATSVTPITKQRNNVITQHLSLAN